MNRFLILSHTGGASSDVPCRPVVGFCGLLALLFLSSCGSTVKVKTDSGRLTRDGIASANLLGKAVGVPFAAVAQFGQSSAALLESAGNVPRVVKI